MRYVTGDGVEVDVLDKTRPKAQKEYQCCWVSLKPHTIKKGEQYVRVVYKRKKRKKLESDHICLDCWCGVPENGE